MPYKNTEKRREANRIRSSQRVDVICEMCGSSYKIRKDTSYKKYKRICSNCKSQFIRDINSTDIDEERFIEDYLKSDLGYQALCRKYHIGDRRGKKILDENNVSIFRKPVWNKGKHEKRKCKVCGKIFHFIRGSKEIYCSKKCQVKDLEWLEGQRRNTLQQISEGKIKGVDTSIELAIEVLLKKHSIEYEKQFVLGYWAFDFCVQNKVLIEADGDYWHGNPNFYENLNPMQRKNQLKQNRKDSYAAKDGFKILHFWGDEIRNNMEEVENEILQNCG